MRAAGTFIAGRRGPAVAGAILLSALALAFAAGCGDSDTVDATTARASAEVTIYFTDDAGTLVAETRAADAATAEQALTALAEGPDGDALFPALPPGTIVRSVTLGGDSVVRVDLSEAFVDGYPSGGAAAEAAVLGPLVFTATELPGADAVLISVDGEVPDPIGSAFDLSVPLTRQDVPAEVAP
jgi:spore germination protein GerM